MDVERKRTISVKLFNKNRIELHKEIGSGSFGKVLKGTLKDAKVQVAVKVFYQEFIGILPNVDSKLRETAYDELSKVAVLDHENIVKLLGMVDDDIPWLVFEYMKDGNLLEYVMRKKDHVKERTLVRFCRDICNGMEFLHRLSFLHKDLAARNILLDGKVAKIADLGLCSFLTEDHDGAYALGGKLFPYRHAASECIVECIFTVESDVWSFGVLLFEIFTKGAVPYGPENKQPEVRRFIADGMNPSNFQEPNCSEEIRGVMDRIFATRREERPTFNELLQAFESLLNSRGVRIPRPRRDVSPFRHNRVQELTGSTDMLSSSPPSSNNSSFPSNPDLTNIPPFAPSSSNRNHHHHHHHHGHSNGHAISQPQQIIHNNHPQHQKLGVSPPNFYGERRNSETPARAPRHVLTVESAAERGAGGERSNSPRRTASFHNISSKQEAHQQLGQQVDQHQNRLLKEFGVVPNRFGGNKKQFIQD